MKSTIWYHVLLAAGFGLIVTVVGYNAATVPDFRFPMLTLHPYELPVSLSEGLRDTAAAVPAPKININKATQSELESLPGIGEKTALKIVEYREKNGRFRSRKALMEVPGIGEKTYEKLKDQIIV